MFKMLCPCLGRSGHNSDYEPESTSLGHTDVKSIRVLEDVVSRLSHHNEDMKRYKTLLDAAIFDGVESILTDIDRDEHRALLAEVDFYIRKMEQACRRTDEQFQCVVCLARKRSAVFEICNHAVCCDTCASELTECPVCEVKTDKAFQRIIL